MLIDENEIKEMVENADYFFRYTYGSFAPNNKNYKIITLVDDYIIVDNSGEVTVNKDKELSGKVWTTINVLTGVIVDSSIKSKGLSHMKDSHKDEIILKMKDNTYLVSGKVSNDELRTTYNNIVSKILEHLNI